MFNVSINALKLIMYTMIFHYAKYITIFYLKSNKYYMHISLIFLITLGSFQRKSFPFLLEVEYSLIYADFHTYYTHPSSLNSPWL